MARRTWLPRQVLAHRSTRSTGAIVAIIASVVLLVMAAFSPISMCPWCASLGLARVDALPTVSVTPAGPDDLTPYVNPFLGTAPGGSHFGFGGNSGDVFPGAAVPLGMVQFSPDTVSHLPGGYDFEDTHIAGLSLTHFSGRGCTVYQDIPLMPYLGRMNASPVVSPATYISHFSHRSEEAHPGYYHVHLDDPDVTAELTATTRSGLARFTFPSSSEANLLVNVGGSVNGVSNAAVTIDPTAREVVGWATSWAGCSDKPYTVYFVAQFDRPLSGFGTWDRFMVMPRTPSRRGAQSGAYITFDTTTQPQVLARVGVSFVSVAHARANLLAEQPAWDFAAVQAAARTAWNAKLGRIRVAGGTPAERIAFYTALYHTEFHPNVFNDEDGSYLGFDGHVHSVAAGHAHYENIPGWDSYRSLMPLRALLDPAEASDIAQSLVDDALQGDGHLPRWEQANSDSLGMNGDSADVLIADSYAYGGTGFDTVAALHATQDGQPRVREGLRDYLGRGYVAAGTTGNSVAITLEYSTDDFAIAQFARALGDVHTAQIYLQRSGSWQHLFNPATGYLQPRSASGAWAPDFQPQSQNGFQEGSAAQYRWMVPFDLGGLIERMGGADAATRQLDVFFTKLNEGADSIYAFMGNEPCLGVPWVYDFAGAPSKTQAVVRRIQTALYKSTVDGLPGNDDAGAMSAWYVFSAIGLYPAIPGVAGFVLSSPLFPSVTVRLGTGQTLQISAPAAADDHPYVQGLTVDGRPSSSLWLPWSALGAGATLDFTLGPAPSAWGTAPADAPPAYAPPSPTPMTPMRE